MLAYGTEFFSMNDVNRLRILQDVIDRRLVRPAGWRFLTDTADVYRSAIVNMSRFHWLTIVVVSLRTAWSRSFICAPSVHLRLQTPLLKSLWLATTVCLRSRHVTISTFTVRSRMMKIWWQHSPDANSVRSQKNWHYSMIRSYICLKIMKKTEDFRGNTLMSGSIRMVPSSSGLTVLPCPS